MVGQINLLNKLNSYSFSEFPKTSMFLGESGSGRHTILKELSIRFAMSIIDISDDISFDYLNEISSITSPTFYLVDMSKIDEKKQNVILKFVEEPPLNAYVVLFSEGRESIIETILNRCIIFELDKYTREELKEFIVNVDDSSLHELILSVCRTPGQVIETCKANNIKPMFDLCNTFVDKLDKASYPNTLTIAKKINYKDEYDKFNINVFLNALLLTIYNKNISSPSNKLYNLYRATSEYIKRLRDGRLNKENLMENYLTKAWKLVRE